MPRTVEMKMGDFALGLLGAPSADGADASRSLVQAVRYYLTDRDSGRAGWSYPSFFGEDGDGPDRKVRLTIDDAIWGEFTVEAERQGVSPDQLLQHAALYFLADRDTGRLTQRILEDLGREEEL
jgi:hypothetical protein